MEQNNAWSSTRISTRAIFVLMYINDLPDAINPWYKIVADDTSLFNKSVKGLNSDLEKISYWAYQWNMHFNPDSNK